MFHINMGTVRPHSFISFSKDRVEGFSLAGYLMHPTDYKTDYIFHPLNRVTQSLNGCFSKKHWASTP